MQDCDTTSIQGRLCQVEAPRCWWSSKTNADLRDVADICLLDHDQDVSLQVVWCRICSEAFQGEIFVPKSLQMHLPKDLFFCDILVPLRACGPHQPYIDINRAVEKGSALKDRAWTREYIKGPFVLRSSRDEPQSSSCPKRKQSVPQIAQQVAPGILESNTLCSALTSC